VLQLGAVLAMCTVLLGQTPEERRLKQVEDAVAKKADAKTVQDALGRVTTLEDAVDNKADATDLEALHQGVDRGFGAVEQTLQVQSGQQKVQGLNINRFWVLLAALLVFFMQAGFKALEVGFVGAHFGTLQAMYKLSAWIATLAGYYFSFGLMFSASSPLDLGRLSIPHFKGECAWGCAPDAVMKEVNCTAGANNNKVCKTADETDRGMEFFLFQLAFAATAVTIPAGAIAERMSVPGYFLMGLCMAVLVYPLFGHWAWGGGAYMDVGTNERVQGVLKWWGFHDFAGSTVVHSVGGWFALAFAQALGPRKKISPPFNRGYAVLGVFLLWFGWWGFNGGSTLLYDNKNTVPNIILYTNIAGATAGFVACTFAWMLQIPWLIVRTKRSHWFSQRFLQPGHIPEKTIGGVLGGLVAITASCDAANPLYACLVGVAAGLVHNMAF